MTHSNQTTVNIVDWRRPTMTVGQAAEILGISRSSAYDAIKLNQIPHLRLGGRILVKTVELAEMLGVNTEPSPVVRRGPHAGPKMAHEPVLDCFLGAGGA